MSDRTGIWLLEHRKRAAAQGVQTLLGVMGTCLGLGFWLPLIFPSLWQDDRLFVIAWYMMLSAVGVAGIWFGVVNLRSSGTFVCRVSRDVLECNVPAAGCGESFSMAISEIAAVEQEILRGEGGPPCNWYIIDKAGRRRKLTRNYNNPADRIVSLLRELNPRIVEITS
jgi:hypothetical protein